MSLPSPKPRPIKLDQFPEGWIENVRAIIERDRYEVRPGLIMVNGQTILCLEIRGADTPGWVTVNLPNNQIAFETATDRDAVVKQLTVKE